MPWSIDAPVTQVIHPQLCHIPLSRVPVCDMITLITSLLFLGFIPTPTPLFLVCLTFQDGNIWSSNGLYRILKYV